MRLLLVARRYPPDAISGRAITFGRLHRHLAERHEVRLVAGYRGRREDIPDDALGVDLSARGIGWSYLALHRAVGATIRKFRPDLVLTQGLEVPFTSAPAVAVVRDLVGTGWTVDRALRTGFYRYRSRAFRRVVVPSQATRETLRAQRVGRWRIEVVPPTVDAPAVPPPRPPDPERLVLLHPGRILPGKGQHLSVDAVSRLSTDEKARVELRVVGLVGDPVYHGQLRIAARGQPITFDTTRGALPAAFGEADTVLYPTALAEGFPDAAVEALTFGRPVVYSDQPGVREAMCGCGMPIRVGDARVLRDAIRARLAHPQWFAEQGRLGRERSVERYGWSGQRGRWEELLQGAARG